MPWSVEHSYPQSECNFPTPAQLTTKCPYCEQTMTLQNVVSQGVVTSISMRDYVFWRNYQLMDPNNFGDGLMAIFEQVYPVGMYAHLLLCNRCKGVSFLLLLSKMARDNKGQYRPIYQKMQVFPQPQDYCGLWGYQKDIPHWILHEVRDIATAISMNLTSAAALLLRRLAESLILTWLRKANVLDVRLRNDHDQEQYKSLGLLLPLLKETIPAIYYKMEPCGQFAQALGNNTAHANPDHPREEIDLNLLRKALDHTVVAIKDYYVALPEQEELKKHAAEAKNKRKSSHPKQQS